MVASYPIEDVTTERIIHDMVGPIANLYPVRNVTPGAPVLEVNRVSHRPIENFSFTIRTGEVVGLIGLKGDGISDLLRTISGVAGRYPPGAVKMNGKAVPSGRSSVALRMGLGYLSEERSRWGILPGRSVVENVSTASLRDFTFLRWLLDLAKERKVIGEVLRTFLVRTPRPESDIRELSGGNQQKALLARLFRAKLDIYILDDPTLGVDVGSKAEINRLMNQQVAGGAGILLSTSDLSELLEMSDRIIVIRHGKVVLEAPKGTLGLEALEALLEGEDND
ncbi:MAG: Ribose transport system, ATP-binding protein RbsA [Devosia sp.]|nr:Ribose transport system, ATP-binding protein RbsA [Devosia sp.]